MTVSDDSRPWTTSIPRDLGATLACEQCGTRTLRRYRCPACGSADLARPVLGA